MVLLWFSTYFYENRCSKRMSNGGPKGVQNDVQTRVPLKTSKMWFRTLFATFQPCPLCLNTLVLGTVLGHPSGVPSEVNKRTPPKHTPEGAYGHLGGPKSDFGAPRGDPFRGKILQNGILEDMSSSLECQGGSEMVPRGPKVPKLT